jgi:6-pyruvoyltetrahydropterin/6-carboxytetrahydropterin synthase
MPFQLTKDFRFEAAHQLVHHDGQCARLHGHSWRLSVCVEGLHVFQEGPKRGMVLDFSDLKAVVQPLVDKFLDHQNLNERLQLDSPTSEAVAVWAWTEIGAALKFGLDARLAWVEIGETCTCACRYWR